MPQPIEFIEVEQEAEQRNEEDKDCLYDGAEFG